LSCGQISGQGLAHSPLLLQREGCDALALLRGGHDGLDGGDGGGQGRVGGRRDETGWSPSDVGDGQTRGDEARRGGCQEKSVGERVPENEAAPKAPVEVG
jgi:hypothetical protein